jgi:hypothetical protein
MFNQIANQNAASGRLLLGATIGAGAWVLVCVTCFVNLGSLPTTLKAPATGQAVPCSCASKQAQPEVPESEPGPRDRPAASRPVPPCRT